MPVILGIIALIAAFIGFANLHTLQQGFSEGQKAAKMVTASPSPKTISSLSDSIKSAAKNIYGDNKVEVLDNYDNPGQKNIIITYNLNDGFLNANDARLEVRSLAGKTFQAVFPLDKNIQSVQIKSTLPTTDAYGKSSKDWLINISLKRDTYNKIVWDNFNTENLKDVADIYTENGLIK